MAARLVPFDPLDGVTDVFKSDRDGEPDFPAPVSSSTLALSSRVPPSEPSRLYLLGDHHHEVQQCLSATQPPPGRRARPASPPPWRRGRSEAGEIDDETEFPVLEVADIGRDIHHTD